MAKGANQKLKLLYLIRIFQEKTDDDHGITMQEIINALAAYGVTAERKSLYDDFETLGVYGIDINKMCIIPLEAASLRCRSLNFLLTLSSLPNS